MSDQRKFERVVIGFSEIKASSLAFSATKEGKIQVRYEGGFCIVTDPYGYESAFPAGTISSVLASPAKDD